MIYKLSPLKGGLPQSKEEDSFKEQNLEIQLQFQVSFLDQPPFAVSPARIILTTPFLF